MEKILIWSVLILITLALSFYYFLRKILFYNLPAKPRNPKVEIKETHSIGWWSKQEGLTISSFEVTIIDSKLNLFNSKSLIKYRIKGSLSYKKGWRPSIKKIHLSERFLNRTNDLTDSKDAIIEITPIVGTEDDKTYCGEKIEFDITNEKTISSFHWGNNYLRFKCINKFNDIILVQKK